MFISAKCSKLSSGVQSGPCHTFKSEPFPEVVNGYHYASLREKCPYLEIFWSVFSGIRTKYGEIRSKCWLIRIRTRNTDFSSSAFDPGK